MFVVRKNLNQSISTATETERYYIHSANDATQKKERQIGADITQKAAHNTESELLRETID